MGFKEAVKQILVRKIEQTYEKQLSRKKVSYHTWVEEKEKQELAAKDVHIVREPEMTLPEDYVLFCQEKGQLAPEAATWLVDFLKENPKVQIAYGDEDYLNEQGVRENPWYKPCWSPDSYLSQFYVGSAIVVKKELVGDTIPGNLKRKENLFFFSDPQELRACLTGWIRQAGGFAKGCKTIAGCSHILFHVTDTNVWKNYLESSEQADLPGESEESSKGSTVDFSDISVIIPSKDNPKVLGKCLESLKALVDGCAESSAQPWITSHPEIIIVDNGSNEENKRQIEALTAGMKYIYRPMAFNFSKMCNLGVEAATGKYILLLNDDIEVCGRGWLSAMKAKARLPYVGAVGLKLYYPDSRKIQHAGITNLPVGPVHKMQFAEDEGSIYFDRNRADMNCLAVTAACLLVEKTKYLEVGGLKESLQVAYNDVDLGFALYEAGYQNVVINTHYAYHHESLSRGNDETREKQARLQREREHLYEMHRDLKGQDPYYPEGLSKDGLDSRIVPAYFGARNQIQKGILEKCTFDPEQVRVDRCLLIGMEQSEAEKIRGFGVVLGDHNACYERYVVLAEERLVEAAEGRCPENMWQIAAQPQYRQDLEENLPDQKYVALSGFHVQLAETELKKLEPGREYRIGVLAVHRINKGKLLNWSSRCYSI